MYLPRCKMLQLNDGPVNFSVILKWEKQLPTLDLHLKSKQFHSFTQNTIVHVQTTHLQAEGTITDEPSNLNHIQVKGRFIFIGRKLSSSLLGDFSNFRLNIKP